MDNNAGFCFGPGDSFELSCPTKYFFRRSNPSHSVSMYPMVVQRSYIIDPAQKAGSFFMCFFGIDFSNPDKNIKIFIS
jgi:hypothetical protein